MRVLTAKPNGPESKAGERMEELRRLANSGTKADKEAYRETVRKDLQNKGIFPEYKPDNRKSFPAPPLGRGRVMKIPKLMPPPVFRLWEPSPINGIFVNEHLAGLPPKEAKAKRREVRKVYHEYLTTKNPAVYEETSNKLVEWSLLKSHWAKREWLAERDAIRVRRFAKDIRQGGASVGTSLIARSPVVAGIAAAGVTLYYSGTAALIGAVVIGAGIALVGYAVLYGLVSLSEHLYWRWHPGELAELKKEQEKMAQRARDGYGPSFHPEGGGGGGTGGSGGN